MRQSHAVGCVPPASCSSVGRAAWRRLEAVCSESSVCVGESLGVIIRIISHSLFDVALHLAAGRRENYLVIQSSDAQDLYIPRSLPSHQRQDLETFLKIAGWNIVWGSLMLSVQDYFYPDYF